MAGRPFLFGKLPAHGDFVARGLSPTAREAWDAAGAALLDALQAAQGERFAEAHGIAPPWRFVTQGEGGWRVGALAPSIDAVGRRFLLAVGLDGLDAETVGAAGLLLAAEAEAVVYDAISGGLSADAALASVEARVGGLEQAARPAAQALAAPARAPGVWWTLGSGTLEPAARVAGEPPPTLFAAGPAELRTAS